MKCTPESQSSNPKVHPGAKGTSEESFIVSCDLASQSVVPAFYPKALPRAIQTKNGNRISTLDFFHNNQGSDHSPTKFAYQRCGFDLLHLFSGCLASGGRGLQHRKGDRYLNPRLPPSPAPIRGVELDENTQCNVP